MPPRQVQRLVLPASSRPRITHVLPEKGRRKEWAITYGRWPLRAKARVDHCVIREVRGSLEQLPQLNLVGRCRRMEHGPQLTRRQTINLRYPLSDGLSV